MTYIDYTHQYPNHCRTCKGVGGHSSGGEEWWDPIEWFDCPDCRVQDKCPRCLLQFSGNAAEDFAEQLVNCPMCGYSHGSSKNDYCLSEREV